MWSIHPWSTPIKRSRSRAGNGSGAGDFVAGAREETPVQISRLLHAHEIVLEAARAMARKADEAGDDGTNDLLVSSVIRTNEMQVWFVAEHVVDQPLVRADGSGGD